MWKIRGVFFSLSFVNLFVYFLLENSFLTFRMSLILAGQRTLGVAWLIQIHFDLVPFMDAR